MGTVKKQISKAAWLKLAQKFVGDNVKLLALAGEAVRYVSGKKGGVKEIKDDVLLLCAYVRDVATGRYKHYKVWNLTIIVAAIIYLVSPIDAIPDFIVGGFIDDMSVIAWAFSKVGKELKMYRLLNTPIAQPSEGALAKA
ncbi:MAG: DUF1232 domain-containing protein [Bacteroidaceae bacterium]|nr:DUF1232 domain-containing protein [Bacteroidaceae bacterium]MBR3443740.1 DUF1232 domain-containing protein [Bacteroidaceae bacterium]